MFTKTNAYPAALAMFIVMLICVYVPALIHAVADRSFAEAFMMLGLCSILVLFVGGFRNTWQI